MMLKNSLALTISFLALTNNAFGAGNLVSETITSIESRYSGYHALRSTLSFNSQTILNEEHCYFSDRVILLESDPAGKTEMALIITAMMLNKNVTLRVDGCVAIDSQWVGSIYTAPKLVKVELSGS